MSRPAVVLDTHAWFWSNNQEARLGDEARSAIAGADGIGVSAVSCWELAMLASKGRLEFPQGVRTWIRQALALPGVVALPLDPEAAVDAALLERELLGADPADRMIYATARSRGALLVTKDRQLRDFDPRGTLW